ncbi:hypothetical protein [Sphingomonas xinjiangensis]|uniref:Uncharacterized protein n=1 Tax=Sphingomonas xinjiangensis TaxID=643568 RepID=A0A840YKC5_9SPHN|nr:hypothetical protein [Sphingomonas xinjiangensis]MBB5709420.1 hypothetical protein [Sphingomonas xinjiangensis]
MRDVLIPPDMEAVLNSPECVNWLLDNTHGSVIGHVQNGKLALRFDDDEEAAAFEARWL